jgi:hypothetical protein
MKKMLLLPFAFVALSGAELHAQPRSSHWKLEVEVNSRLRFTLRIESHAFHDATLHAFRLQIMQTRPSDQLLIDFEIGERPHA